MLKNIDRLKLASELGATFDYQQNIIACKDQYRTVRKPRQAGMTTAFAIEALIDALIYDNYVICIVSPTARQSARMMRYIKKALMTLEKKFGHTIPTEKFTQEEVYFHHRSEIYSLPNNPKGIQGIDCNHAIVDEAGLFPQTEGMEVIDAIVGSLAAKKGRLTISGKPKGKQGLLWKYWDPDSSEYENFTHFTITWEDRARQDPIYAKEVEKHRKILTKLQFDETYNAEFIDEGILVYPHELLEKAIELFKTNKFVVMPAEGTPSAPLPRYVGIDFGRKRNLTEIHVLQKEESGIYRTLMTHSMNNKNFEDQKVFIDDLIRRVRPMQVKVDEMGQGYPLLDYLTRQHGTMVQPLKMNSLATKEKTVLQLRNAFLDLQIAIPNDTELYIQLHSFQKQYTDAGNVRYSGKVDESDFKDDKVVALIAAYDAAMDKAFSFGIC